MNILDTRDLIEERDTLKQNILDAWNEEFENNQIDDFSELPTETEDSNVAMFLERWDYDFTEIQEIDDLENEIDNGEWEYGTLLIDEDDFEEYCEEFVTDCGYISKDTPSLITNNIDWSGIAEDMKQDYSEVVFRGTTYLYR